MKRKLETLLWGIVLGALLYTIVAITVFRFRHPWVTETELMLNIPAALQWEKVSYDDVRNR